MFKNSRRRCLFNRLFIHLPFSQQDFKQTRYVVTAVAIGNELE